MARSILLISALISVSFAVDLILTNQNITLGGYHTYGTVKLTNSTIWVPPFNGKDFTNTGHLSINATSVYIDATSMISARGAGYSTLLCSDGLPTAIGGAGGCSVKDSGGGGGHIGTGGIGTTDCPIINGMQVCHFPQNFEQDCYGTANFTQNRCNNYTDCRTGTGLPTTAGSHYWHSIYDAQLGMGGSGGDAGCRDGDGFSANQPVLQVGGNGGGRIRLYVSGDISVYGTITVAGFRGCGVENDSGGGGAAGSMLLLADNLWISNATTVILATGGRGGDQQDKSAAIAKGQETECIGTQFGGTCDDCGGGGGGGLIYILTNGGNYYNSLDLVFNVSGANGGICPGCSNEAKGIDGVLQLGHEGEVCNGEDDTFDGLIDEDQPMLPCGISSCINGVIQTCPDGPTGDTDTSDEPSSASTSTSTSTGRAKSTTFDSTSTSTSSNSDSTASGSDSGSNQGSGSDTASGTNTASGSNQGSGSNTASGTNSASGTASGTNASGTDKGLPSSTGTGSDMGESNGISLIPATLMLIVATFVH